MDEIIIIALLILLNGLFNMYEIAFFSSRKSKLEEKAGKGNLSARQALNKLNKPERFLSEIQTSITTLSIISGAYSGIALSRHFAVYLHHLGYAAPYVETVALIIVIGMVTYFSLIFGELVPKTIALNNPEKLTLALTPFMSVVAAIVSPVAWFLSISTRFILKVFGIKKNSDPPVTEEELKILIKQGSEHGVLEEQESEIIHDVFSFADKTAYAMMTPNKDVVWLDINLESDELMKTIVSSPFSRIPVCNGSIDKVVGIVYAKDILRQCSSGVKLNLIDIMTPPFFIPETVKAIRLLDDFKKKQIKLGIVVNEYGETHGIITAQDIADNVLGDFPDVAQDIQPQLTMRDDGSFLVDGDFQFDEMMEHLEIEVPDDFKEIRQNITTIGGFIMYMLNKVPAVGEHIYFEGYRFEVMDMDGNRVDKVLIAKEAEKEEK